jgi:hypothetical protein
MTPQGHMFAGWITFSASDPGDGTVAQTQVLMRAQDPLSELGLTFGGHKAEDRFWQHTLTALAEHLGVAGAAVETQTHVVDRRRQWSKAKNIWQSAAIRSGLYAMTAPLRWLDATLRPKPKPRPGSEGTR